MLEPYIPSASEPFDYTRAAHLLRRAMIAPTHMEIQTAVDEGLEKTMNRLFTSYQPSLTHIHDFAGKEPWTAPPPQGKEYDEWYAGHVDRITRLLQWLHKNIYFSPVSITERMILFWHRHFPLRAIMYAEYAYMQNVLLRRNSLGNFKQMMHEQTTNTLMHQNLNFFSNYVAYGNINVNENYAREMLELFTVGLLDELGNHNYTQTDVHEAARSFTGWFFGESTTDDLHTGLESRFLDNRWDAGEKTFLGKTGKWKSADIINILFDEKPIQIAKRICTKLYKTFVSEAVDTTVVNTLAQVFRSSNWEIQPVLQMLLTSKHFFDASKVGVLKKSHIEYVMGVLRQFQVDAIMDFNENYHRSGNLIFRMQRWGDMMFSPPNISGWFGGRDWINTSILPHRIEFAKNVMEGTLAPLPYVHQPNVYTINITDFTTNCSNRNSKTAFVDWIVQYLLPIRVSAEYKDSLLSVLLTYSARDDWNIDDPDSKSEELIRKVLSLVVTHPSYQLY
ncbi:MAG: DUF1800 family protein [Candidatus Kapabacteria bacterium]|nr:DUF1800 family protein [Candidatus Kapabacteria bacterium]